MDASVSVVIAKTTMTIAQVTYILVGLALGVWLLSGSTGTAEPAGQFSVAIRATLAALAVLVFGAIAMVVIQRWGMFGLLFRWKSRMGFRNTYLEARMASLLAFDEAVRSYYRSHPRRVVLSVVCFLLGWLLESAEVFVILYGLDVPIAVLQAVAIGGIAVGIKAAGFFIPGSLGGQDGGNVVLLMLYGYSDATGMAFPVLRRMREVVWVAIGLVCLFMFRARGEA